jgi:hypothetical protein
MNPIKSRIKRHIKIKASELVPHELNPRIHPEHQRQALEALYDEIGFARSLLAFELPDGRLKLIDGHLRQMMTPDMEVDVEVLDVDDAEARALLLSIDPIVQLAENDQHILDELLGLTQTDNPMLQAFWANMQSSDRDAQDDLERKVKDDEDLQDQFLVLIECSSEEEQTTLLRRFMEEGLNCRALVG